MCIISIAEGGIQENTVTSQSIHKVNNCSTYIYDMFLLLIILMIHVSTNHNKLQLLHTKLKQRSFLGSSHINHNNLIK